MRALIVVVLVAIVAFCADCSATSPSVSADGKSVLFVVGMDDEARVATAGPGGALVVKSGASPAHLQELLAHVDRSRIRAVVSFGVAGALKPTLLPGEIVIADRVVARDAATGALSSWPVDQALTAALSSSVKKAGAHAHKVGFFGVDTMTSSPADRARMLAEGAGAVDMESHVAAAWAQKNGLPFAALRTISDGVTFVVPPAMEHSILLDGSIDVGAVVGGVAGDPSQVGALLAAQSGYGKAMKSLTRCREKMAL